MFKELNNLRPFFEKPNMQYSVREIARKLDITPATASKKLKEFAKKEILKYEKSRAYDLYQANVDNVAFRDIKVYYSITKIRQSKLLEELNKFYIKPTIILFGSIAVGYDTEESDIDLVVISENEKEFPEHKDFERKLKRKIQLFIVRNLKDLKNEHLINNVLGGIVLQGEIIWI